MSRLVRTSASPSSPTDRMSRSSSGVSRQLAFRARHRRRRQLLRARVQPPFQRPHHRRRDPGGMPVHPHHAAERLKPERIAKPREQAVPRDGAGRPRKWPCQALPSGWPATGGPGRRAAGDRQHRSASPDHSARLFTMPTRRDTLRGIALASAGALGRSWPRCLPAVVTRTSAIGPKFEPRVIEDVRLRWRTRPGRLHHRHAAEPEEMRRARTKRRSR